MMETMTAESQRAQRNCIFPRTPERGILGKGASNILNFYTFCQTIVLHFALSAKCKITIYSANSAPLR